jgi:hypothetical protein
MNARTERDTRYAAMPSCPARVALVEATVLLCDYAEAVNGKLYVMGGGWNVAFAAGQPMNAALAILVIVPWDQTNQKHELRVELVDDDGNQVAVQGQEVRFTGEFELGRPPGIKPGTSLNAPFAWNLQGLQLPHGSYQWKLWIDTEPVESRAFQVLPRPAGTPAPG